MEQLGGLEKPITKEEIINFVRNPNQIVGNDPVEELDGLDELNNVSFLIAVLEELQESATGERLALIERYLAFLEIV